MEKTSDFFLYFPKFCERVLNYKSITIQEGDYQPHNRNVAWRMFIQNEQKNYFGFNNSNDGLDTDILDLGKIQWEFVSPWITRYDNASPTYREEILNQFAIVLKQKYFNSAMDSDSQ
ncbi:MAG: hypothetical protein KBT13_03710 [Bacteroidales bacterium]|nr:hypothetical protein [Candidatus Sodaliphilus limicaballi]